MGGWLLGCVLCGVGIMEAILLCVAASVVIGLFGSRRRFGFWGYFFCSLALTPVVGLIVLLASTPQGRADAPTT